VEEVPRSQVIDVATRGRAQARPLFVSPSFESQIHETLRRLSTRRTSQLVLAEVHLRLARLDPLRGSIRPISGVLRHRNARWALCPERAGPSKDHQLAHPVNHMRMKAPVISREEAGPKIKAGVLTPAYLYEAQHAPRGTRFVYVKLAPGHTQLYRVRR
jgi:hypothetical protein